MAPDVNTAEASTADAQPTPLTGAIKEAWNQGKEAPVQAKPKPAESATADPSKETKSEPKDDTEGEHPDTEPGKKSTQENKSQPHRKPAAEDRIKELLAQNKKLQSELEESRRSSKPDDKKAEPSPAKPPEPTKLEAPKKPKLDDFNTYDEYEEARDKYTEELAEYKAKVAIQESEDRKRQAEAQNAFKETLKQARERYADFDDVAIPASKAIFEDEAVNGAVKAMLNDSPLMTDVLYVLGGEQKDLKEFIDTAKTRPTEAIRKLVILERLVGEELAKGSTKDAKPAADKTPVKPIAKAPKPPAEVDGRGTNTEDPDVAVARSGSLTKQAKEQWDRSYSARAR